MKKFFTIFSFLIILSFILITSSLFSEDVFFYNGESIKNSNVLFENGFFNINGVKYSKYSIKKILFSKANFKKFIPDPDNLTFKQIKSKAKEALIYYSSSKNKYPAILVYDLGEQKIFKEGYTYYKYHAVYYINDAKSFNFENLTIGFQPNISIVYLYKLRVYHKDGSITNYDPETIYTADYSSNLEYFHKSKIFSVKVPEFNDGDIIEYEYSVVSRPPYPIAFLPSWSFEGVKYPYYYSEIKYIYPADRNLKYYITKEGKKIKIETSVKGEYKITSFSSEKNGVITIEQNSPPYSKISQTVITSLFNSYEEMFTWYNKILLERIKITPEIKDFVLKYTKDKKSDYEKVKFLYHWIQRNIKYISIKDSISTSLGGHPAIETFKNRIGDCIDRAILFTTMLKVINIKAYPIVIQTFGTGVYPYYEKIPNLTGNHAINVVYINNKRYFLDTTHSDLRFPFFRLDDRGIYYLSPLENKVGFIPPADYKEMTDKIIIEGKLGRNTNLRASVELLFNGSTEAMLRYYFRKYKGYENYFIRRIVEQTLNNTNIISGKNTDPEDMDLPFGITAKIRVPNFLRKIGEKDFIIVIPDLYKIYFENFFFKKRINDVIYNYQERTLFKLKLNLYKYKIKSLPSNLKIDNKYYKIEVNYEVKGKELLINIDFIRKWLRITPVEIEKIKENIIKVFYKNFNTPIILTLPQ